MSFVAHRKGGTVKAIVEGDDGLTVSSVPLNTKDFTDMGFTIKMNKYQNVEQTSFCGLILSRENTGMVDPRGVMLKFPWTHARQMFGGPRVVLGLLRAKALSLIYEFPSCPIVTALGLRYEKLTRDCNPIFGDTYWERLKNDNIPDHPEARTDLISNEVRLDFEMRFGISVAYQRLIEDEIVESGLERLGGCFVESLYADDHDVKEYFDKYVSTMNHKHIV
jgi:hypothetical protein